MRRILIHWLGGVIREPERVEVVPASLLAALRLADGLLSDGKPNVAQSQIRAQLAIYTRDGFVAPKPTPDLGRKP